MECANNERMNPLNMANKQDGSGEAEAEAETGIQNNVLLSKPRLQFQLAGRTGKRGHGTAPSCLRVCRNCHIKMDDLFVLLIYCATTNGPPRLVEGNCCHRRWRDGAGWCLVSVPGAWCRNRNAMVVVSSPGRILSTRNA